MKTISKMLAAALAVLTAASSVSLTAFASENELETNNAEAKIVDVYLYSTNFKSELPCLFTDELPDMPYISAEDYMEVISVTDFDVEDLGDSVYKLSGCGGALTVDAENDTLKLDSYENIANTIIANNKASDTESLMIVNNEIFTIAGEDKSPVINFADYGIDLIENDGVVYFPLATISDLFSPSYTVATYVDNSIYFDIFDGSFENCYFNRDTIFNTLERSQEIADYSYNELCFVMDNIYGAPPKAKISESVKEKGFDKTLDEYSDITRAAKDYLKSTRWAEYLYGLYLLTEPTNDDGHTALCAGIMIGADDYKDSPLLTAFQKLTDNEDDEFAESVNIFSLKQYMANREDDFKEAREKSYSKMKLVKEWDSCTLYTDGDLAIFVFDSFEESVIEPFKWSVDYAAENGIKNFALDVSCNGGGDSSVMWYLVTLMTNKNRDKNSLSYNMLCTLTGNLLDCSCDVDLDLNGVVNDEDKKVGYDLNFAIICSRVSFSCGNFLPCIAQDMGIPVIGETSGGGTCMLGSVYWTNGAMGAISTSFTLLRAGNKDVDSGAVPDYLLPTDDDELLTFYDLDKIKAAFADHYKLPAPAEEDSQPEQESHPEEKPAPSNGGGNPNTGAGAGLLVLAASAALAVVSKKKA